MPSTLPIVVTLVSMALLAIFAVRHFASARAGLIAVVLFAVMPLVWLAARGGAPQLVLVPFLLAWLLCIDVFLRGGSATWLAIAGAAAAQMIYLHQAGLVMAPVYLAVAATVLLARRDRMRAIAALAVGFALIALPWALATVRDPQPLTNTINAYGLYDATRFNPLQGMRELTSWIGLTVRSEVYWDCFNPALLFLGPGGLASSLVSSSVFLLPFAIPLVRGLLAYLFHPRDSMDLLVLGAFATAPLAAALIAQRPSAPRLILLAPMAAIIATRGCYPGAFRTTAAGSPATPRISATAS
jgi:hypothetical protein